MERSSSVYMRSIEDKNTQQVMQPDTNPWFHRHSQDTVPRALDRDTNDNGIIRPNILGLNYNVNHPAVQEEVTAVCKHCIVMYPKRLKALPHNCKRRGMMHVIMPLAQKTMLFCQRDYNWLWSDPRKHYRRITLLIITLTH